MSFTGNGITNCYPDQVDNFVSITVLNPVRWSLYPDDSVRLQQIRWPHSQLGNHPETVEVRGDPVCVGRLTVVGYANDLGVFGSPEEIQRRAGVSCKKDGRVLGNGVLFDVSEESSQERRVEIVLELFEREHKLRILSLLDSRNDQ